MLKHSGMSLQAEIKQSGFTLMELMVTLVIFSFVMVTLFSSFNSFISTGQSIADGVDYNERARDVFRRVLDDLTDIYMPESRVTSAGKTTDDPDENPYQMTGKEISVGGRSFSTLEFASLSGLQTGRGRPSGVVRVIYYVRENSRGLFDLCRAERPVGIDRDKDPCTDPVLARDIAGFTIDFIDTDSGEHQEWDADKDKDDEGGASLRVLNIGLTLKGDHKEKTYETAVVLPVQEQTGD